MSESEIVWFVLNGFQVRWASTQTLKIKSLEAGLILFD